MSDGNIGGDDTPLAAAAKRINAIHYIYRVTAQSPHPSRVWGLRYLMFFYLAHKK